jgi:SAM-dependent methyltransferase
MALFGPGLSGGFPFLIFEKKMGVNGRLYPNFQHFRLSRRHRSTNDTHRMQARPELTRPYCMAPPRPQYPAVSFSLTRKPGFAIYLPQKSGFLSPHLTFGAGSGFVSRSLADKEYTNLITACDRDLVYMRELPDHQKISKKICDDSRSLPFDDRSFDVVVCRYTFHHIEHKAETLREFSRVLTDEGIFLYSDQVLPEHSRDILNPLSFIREDHFHGYLDYYGTIDLLERTGFRVVLARPYTYRYTSFDKYLEGVDDGFSGEVPYAFSDQLKAKLTNAWNHLDERTQREMRIEPHSLSSGFSYYLIDLALKKAHE